MRGNVQVLAWIYIVVSGFHVLIGLLMFLAFLGIGAFAGVAGALPAIPILGGVGAFVFFIILAVYLPGLLAGIGMLSYAPWARILAIVISVFQLFYFPIGTALGAFGLYVLCNSESVRLFEGHATY